MKQFVNYIPPSWDELFMRGAYWIATKSKDPRTKIGSCVVRNNRPIAWGFNGIPQGVKDLPERMERPIKYKFMAHAERNACYGSADMGVSLNGATMYTQGIPCVDCAIGVIQSKIKEIVVHKQWMDWEVDFLKNRDKWKDGDIHTTAMFEESGVKLRILDLPLGVIGYMDGNEFDV